MLKRPHYIALSLVVLLVVVLVNLPLQTASSVKLALGSLFLPLFGLATSAHALTEQAANSLTPRPALLAKLERLERENHEFKIREMQVNQIFRENERLRDALQWQRQSRFKLRAARVVLRDPANWWRTVQIDAGQEEGVVLDLPVVTPEGLVGRIQQVGRHRSRVALIGDPNCPLSAVVEEGKLRDFGVISSGSAGLLDGSLVNLTYVSRPTALKPGQTVHTSGLGGIFPQGLLIGHIVDTNNVGFGLYVEARVKLGANLESLEEVWVVLP